MSLLSAENLSVRLGDKAVLAGVSAAFAPGLVTAVVGPNGAGKSTLLDCLAALRRPDAGQVTLDGRALRDLRNAHASLRTDASRFHWRVAAAFMKPSTSSSSTTPASTATPNFFSNCRPPPSTPIAFRCA